MKDDYLWDGSGEPDPGIQRLEAVLGALRHRRPAPEFPGAAPSLRPSGWPRVARTRWFLTLSGAAAAVLVAIAVGLLRRRPTPGPAERPGWNVASLAGAPQLGSRTIGKTGRLRVGETLETDSDSRASIMVGDIGEVEVEPHTRLRLLQTDSGRKRLALDRGTIQAAIWAAPGEFVVDTPSAVAVDLGCAYTLSVDGSGAGVLRTTFGWVAFKLGGRESLIPAGAECATRPGAGPGTPCFQDATKPLRAALSKLDFERENPRERRVELDTILSQARPRDAFTLWHLLARLDGSDRTRVYNRLAALVPPPPGVTRQGVLRLDQRMLDLWWNKFGLGDVSLWRAWERSWSGHN